MSANPLAAAITQLPELVRTTRKRRGLTLREAAPEIGVSVPEMSRFENAQRDVRASTVIRYAEWLDLEDGDQ